MKKWFHNLTQGLKQGLQKSSQKITTGITEIFTHKKLDADTIEAFEELLIQTDMGYETALDITEKLRKKRFGEEVSPPEIKAFLAEEIEARLQDHEGTLEIDTQKKPFVLLMAGVNGAGKTTTIAKLAKRWQKEGHSLMFAACDTFRAAAVEQLQTWGNRLDIEVIAKPTGADAAGLAYDALQKAKRDNIDILIIDTAGRLQNNTPLMGELSKIVRVLQKQDAALPHATLLVLDATTGQNAVHQVETFGKTLPLTGLVLTKLDGSAKGGVLLNIAQQHPHPLYYIGVGEKDEDLQPFSAKTFGASLVDL